MTRLHGKTFQSLKTGADDEFLSRSLYIQALTIMQNTPESDLLSYYQISGKNLPPRWISLIKETTGIHGRPYTSWDNVGPGHDAPLTGYCTHGECCRAEKDREPNNL
jgi:hypothetical protein